ncbi:hypothetical protein FYK55_27575 [Roseiconus nitratireducens]|uniref:Uncharacterized protein n=1 Tax=Roseiconus nitratireducens TaxID=2605748 RepID=A0A5M6CTZ1_9BACT|nr:hypothetical protein [Roseiconus nitratireducens]KAA5538503.1 hypothetical protein FYK55_27575 [Roseiconus nitratireducens]
MSVDKQHPQKRRGVYSAPRKFDLATVLVVTTAFAMLFAFLNALGASSLVTSLIAILLVLVALGQAVLFGGRHPRQASLAVGSVFSVVVVALLGKINLSSGPDSIIFSVLGNLAVGALYGYFAGVLVGSVFMVSELLRKLMGQT